MSSDKCCELIDGKAWDRKTIEWKDKPFVKDRYLALFYMPIGADKKIAKWMDGLKSRNLMPDGGMMLWRNEGLFGGEMLIPIKKDASDLPVEKISGRFFTMFFEGKDYPDAGRWHKAFDEEAKKKGLVVEEKMTWYVLCPACIKKFGKLQGVIFGRL
ncbi:MAG: hydrolase [Candidatus Micrarchaeota archaeon]